MASCLEISQFKIFPHFKFISYGPNQNPYKECIMFLSLKCLEFTFFPHLRREISNLNTILEPKFRVCVYKFGAWIV
jgi:hypothetical protein